MILFNTPEHNVISNAVHTLIMNTIYVMMPYPFVNSIPCLWLRAMDYDYAELTF
jgi:hypothetical protein